MNVRAALSLALCIAGGPAATQEADFTFRRVGVPEPKAVRRITVQVPLKPVLLRPVPPVPAAPAPRASAPPSARHLERLAATWGQEIMAATHGTRVSPALVLAVMAVESSGRTDAVSPAGAAGLMQLMPATAARFGVVDPLHPGQSIRGGVAYLQWLAQTFGGDAQKIVAGYNAGEGAVLRHGGVPPYAETLDYVPKVFAAFDRASTLCETPPQRISDDCTFAVRR